MMPMLLLLLERRHNEMKRQGLSLQTVALEGPW